MKKTCRECGLTKPVEQFQKRSDSADGLFSACKFCVSQDQHNRRTKFHHGDTLVNDMMRRWGRAPVSTPVPRGQTETT